MLQKAETRLAKKNDTSGNNPFTVLQSTTNCKLARIANNCGAVLSDNVEQIDSMIDILKAKEQAEAVLAENRCKVILERERKECLGDVSPIGLANFQCCVQDSNEDDDSSVAILMSELPTPSSPLSDLENLVMDKLRGRGSRKQKLVAAPVLQDAERKKRDRKKKT
jgi:hypothetical protein